MLTYLTVFSYLCCYNINKLFIYNFAQNYFFLSHHEINLIIHICTQMVHSCNLNTPLHLILPNERILLLLLLLACNGYN